MPVATSTTCQQFQRKPGRKQLLIELASDPSKSSLLAASFLQLAKHLGLWILFLILWRRHFSIDLPFYFFCGTQGKLLLFNYLEPFRFRYCKVISLLFKASAFASSSPISGCKVPNWKKSVSQIGC